MRWVTVPLVLLVLAGCAQPSTEGPAASSSSSPRVASDESAPAPSNTPESTVSTSSSEEPELPYPPGAPTDPSDPNPKKLSGIIVQTGGCFAMTTESGTYALVAGPGVTLPVGSWVTVDYTPASSAGGCPGTPVTVTGAKLVG